MNYSRIYGAKDAGAAEPKYPAVFDMKINGSASKPYTLGNKVALVSAVAMKNATVNGLRKSEIYLHHSRDPGAPFVCLNRPRPPFPPRT